MPPCGDTPGTLPYRPVCGVRLMKLCARRDFVACLDQSHSTNRPVWERLHTAARPPQTGCPASTGIGAADGHPTGQARPRGYLGPACSVGGQSVPVVRVSGGRKNAFFGGCARGCAPHTKLHVKSEGGWSAPGCCQNRVVQTVPASLPPKAIWRPKPTLKACCAHGRYRLLFVLQSIHSKSRVFEKSGSS